MTVRSMATIPNKANLGAKCYHLVSHELQLKQQVNSERTFSSHSYISQNSGKTLPVPMMNIINGGSHSDAPIAFQEFMIMPADAESFTHAMQIGSEIFHITSKKILSQRGLLTTSVGDEEWFCSQTRWYWKMP